MVHHSTKSAPLGRSFGIDTRTLALFRVSAAGLILLDLGMRARDLHAHYAAEGAYPREAVLETFGPLLTNLSIHYHLAGSPFLLGCLFILAAIFAIALLVGWHTRLFTVLSWYMLASLHVRNPEVTGGGDAVFRMLLFWSMFLPLGARWSFDAAVNSSAVRHTRTILSIASAALLLQMAFVYWFSVGHKFGPSWWNGEALTRAVEGDFMIQPLGIWLRGHESLTEFMTWSTLVLEIFGPLLAFIPFWTGRIRMLIIPIFILFHITISATIMVMFFPFAMILGWLAFVPGGFWDWLFARLDTDRRRQSIIYYDGDCGFCKRMVSLVRTFLVHPSTPSKPAQDEPAIEALMRQENSWVFVDHTGERHFRYDAFVRLCRISPLWLIAWPVAWLLTLVGRPAYRWIAENRDRASDLAFFLKPRSVALHNPPGVEVIVSMLLAYVFLQNLGEVGFAYSQYSQREDAKEYISDKLPQWPFDIALALRPPAWLQIYFGQTLQLNQRWTLFAPVPRPMDFWWVFAGTRPSGKQVDVWRLTTDLDWEEPSYGERDMPNHRWHTFMAHPPESNLSSFESRTKALARWAMRRWNDHHPADEHLERIDIVLVLEPIDAGVLDRPQPVRLISMWATDAGE